MEVAPFPETCRDRRCQGCHRSSWAKFSLTKWRASESEMLLWVIHGAAFWGGVLAPNRDRTLASV